MKSFNFKVPTKPVRDTQDTGPYIPGTFTRSSLRHPSHEQLLEENKPENQQIPDISDTVFIFDYKKLALFTN